MCLQYAIWAMAANGHATYGIYHDIFYQRARQYLEADELKVDMDADQGNTACADTLQGDGEHFLSVCHAQAWALTATDEARSMKFTRAAMSSARCVRLVEMMGLHRLDDPNNSLIAPTIAPPVDWVEAEERRRIFWASFCMDSHASINTGWPTLIDLTQVCSSISSTSAVEQKAHLSTLPGHNTAALFRGCFREWGGGGVCYAAVGF